LKNIENNNILIPHHSCETSLSLVLKQWKELVDQNKVIISVFLDLKRPFGTIDCQILLQKLLCYGITKIEYEWFISIWDFNKLVLMEFYLRLEKYTFMCRRALLSALCCSLCTWTILWKLLSLPGKPVCRRHTFFCVSQYCGWMDRKDAARFRCFVRLALV
jgi:hypothetical protein